MKSWNKIKRFISKDDIRPKLMHAYAIDGTLFASDAHILVKANTDLPNGAYNRKMEKVADTPNGLVKLPQMRKAEPIPNYEQVLSSVKGRSEMEEIPDMEGVLDFVKSIGRDTLVRKSKKENGVEAHVKTPCGTFLSEYLLAIADLFTGRKVKCYKGKEQFDGSHIPIFIDDEGTEALVMPIAISNTVDDFPKVSYTDNRKEIYF